MEKIIGQSLGKQKKLINNCTDSKQLSCFIQEIESEMSEIKTQITENQMKFKEGDTDAKGSEWYRLKVSNRNYLVRLKCLVVQRIAIVKAEEKANYKPLEKQPKKLAYYFMNVARDMLDDVLFNEIVEKAKLIQSQEQNLIQ